MPVESHIDTALTRVERERTHVEAERRAFKRFHSEVASLSPQPATAQSTIQSAGGGSLSISGRSHRERTETDARRIRELFAETVRPYSVADLDTEEPLLETIREELGDSIAIALAPGTDAEFTPQVQGAICSIAKQRQRKLDAMDRALDRERESLETAVQDYQTITDWLMNHNQTSLFELGYPELQRRHEQLSAHRDRCEDRLSARQETLQATTSRDAQIGLAHHSLVPYLYQELSVSYPVLSTLTRLDSVLADCQRTVRNHLTRRV